MKHKTTLALGLVAATALAFPAFASGDHTGQKQVKAAHQASASAGMSAGMASDMDGDMGGKSGVHGAKGMAGGMSNGGQMMPMMQKMMKMHSQMMGGSMMGGMGMEAGHGNAPMNKAMDTDGDGKVSAEEAKAALAAQLATFDADGDGTLSIAEYEALNSANNRDMMVDRFQQIDSDGDGIVTAEEMAAAAEKMTRMQGMAAMGGMGDDDGKAPHGAEEADSDNMDGGSDDS
jgi:EF hand